MQNKSKDGPEDLRGGTEQQDGTAITTEQPGMIARGMQSLLHMGLGELLLRAATNIFSVLAIAIVIWLAQMYFRQPSVNALTGGHSSAVPTAIPEAPSSIEASPFDLASEGIPRQADLHTNVPERARQDIVKYTVQKGDTVSGIADRYGLQPKTIFAANYEILQDNPENLQPDQQLRILPVDGVYWEWLGGIPFGEWAAYFKVKPQDIISYPANHLDPAAVGDPENATIKTSTFLIIPGGEYQYHTPGQLPLGITRSNPASAQVAGSGACAPVTGGAIGTGTFIFPTDRHYLSGYDYSPKTNHLAIDLAAELGDNVYASDGGVVVYAGSNSYGYGNMIMVDHGTGFQTLYAHLSAIFVQCGFNVTQAQVIGSAGSTGHSSGAHLHFEVRTSSAVINPWDVLPAP